MKNLTKHILTAFLLTPFILTPFAIAQTHDHDAMPGMTHDTPPINLDQPAPSTTDYYADAMKTMHEKMMVPATGDADYDFVRGMIPHHQGAIDMAKVLLEKGKDPELKKLATGIIAAQEKEISFMKDWLSTHSPNPAK